MKRIILFNFESDQNSQALAFALDWVNEIAKNVDKLYVISLRCGDYSVNDNVEVHCIGQNKKNKLQTIFTIWKILKQIHNKDKNIHGYFVHMAHYFVPLIYPFAKFYNQKIVLWYAHKAVTFSLKVADFFTNVAVASTLLGYQVNSNKLKVIGQGIDTEKFNLNSVSRERFKNCVVVGRISKIKNIDYIIKVFVSLQREDIFLYIVGDALSSSDITYFKDIKESIPLKFKDNIIFKGSIPFEDLPELYCDMDLAINLSDTGSLDKAIIEPMSMGIPVITSNDSAKEIFPHLDGEGVYLLDNKEELKEELKDVLESDRSIDKEALREEIVQKHSLENLAKKIVGEFK